ncbi:MAG: T9SS C-terminal target domain-containing protein [Candidatus Latescibacterota bacterium]|nr:MAG: T9SS C-terminal target domain-containing protein [Candidatus Latescibacterota bacterium]
MSTGVSSTPTGGPLLLLGPARPNPFASETSVRWAGARGDAVLAGVYDVRGRLVRELAAPAGGPQEGVLAWNGRGASGEPLPAGVYFLRVRSGGAAESRKVILVR